MHDLVIRDATVVDGTGAARFRADVAVDGPTIVEVGSEVGRGRSEVDAAGLLLTPGWVDIHTHYDAQVLWDPQLAPSSWHGVTSTIIGNCGLGLAPAPPSAAGRARLASLLEGVEEISSEVVNQIVDWSWETFPQFLDHLAGRPLALDVGAYLPHGPLRVYAMGERGADPTTTPDDDELDHLRSLTIEALEAGAFGFSTSQSKKHRTSEGLPAPSSAAGTRELAAIADGFREVGGGVIEAIVDFEPLEPDFGVLRELASRSGAPVTFPLVQRPASPDTFRRVMELVRGAQREGLSLLGQVAPRPIGVLVGLGTTRNPFHGSRRFRELDALPAGERFERLSDPAVRDEVLGELDEEADAALGRATDLGDPPNYSPAPERRLSARAAEMGIRPAALAYDLVLERHGTNLLFLPGVNCGADYAETIRTMLTDDFTVLGLSDGGAHYARTCDVSFPTYLLTEWVRPPAEDGDLSLEQVVRWQTRDLARLMGLRDRGVVSAGMRADLNLIDLERLSLRPPRLVHDVPGGGVRMVQDVAGYEMTFVAGVRTQQHGSPTGRLPGQLLRRGRQPAS